MNFISKNTILKKYFFIIFIMILVTILFIPISYGLKDTVKTGGITYSINPDQITASVTGYDGSIKDVFIPESINFNGKKYLVTRIAISPFHRNTNLKSIHLGDEITVIDEMAFYGSQLNSVYFGKNINTIGDKAFSNCDKLIFVTLPENISKIGTEAFSECDSLKSIFVEKNNKNYYDIDGVLIDKMGIGNKKGITLVQYPNGKESLNYTIPNSIEHIGDKSFLSCLKIKNIIISDNVKTIGTDSFMYCKKLESASLGEGVTEINSRGFYQCSNLKSISIPDKVTYLGDSVFALCSNLNDFYWGKGLSIIPSSSFSGCSSLKEINIPNHVVEIKKAAFNNCDGLTKIKIGGNVKSIGNNAFSDCNNIYEIQLENGVQSIGDNGFFLCKNLLNITIPESVKTIGSSAFAECKKLNKATILNYNATIFSDNQINTGSISDAFYNSPIVIYGYTGSTAESYAKLNGVEFRSIGNFSMPLENVERSEYYLSGYAMNQMENRDGEILLGTALNKDSGLTLKGGIFTNGNIVNGRTDGNAIETLKKFDVRNTKIYGSFAVYGDDYSAYLGFGVSNMPSGEYITTNHSWNNSKVVKSGTVLYKTITFTDSEYDIRLTTGNYYGRDGAELIYENVGKLTDDEKEAIKNEQIIFFTFGDNYGNDKNYMELYALLVEPYENAQNNSYEELDSVQKPQGFRLNKEGPIYLSVGERIELKAIVPENNSEFNDVYPRWGISNSAIAEISGSVISGYSNFSASLGVTERFITTSDKSLYIEGKSPGMATLSATIGAYATAENPNPKTERVEIIIYVK